jgi:hypothetical protein
MSALALEPGAQTALITTVGAVFVALIGVGVELLRRQAGALADVRNQVSNEHSTNLREDVDRLHGDVLEVLTTVRELGEDLRQERRDRQSLSDRLDHHVNQTHISI